MILSILSTITHVCAKISPSVAIDVIKTEIQHTHIIKKEFNRDTVDLYHDNYSTTGLRKSYVVNKVLENFKSKEGQYIEILQLEQFGKSLFIDNEIHYHEDHIIKKISYILNVEHQDLIEAKNEIKNLFI